MASYQIVQSVSIPNWASLEQADWALREAGLDTLQGQRMISTGNHLFTYQSVIDRIWKLKPDLNSSYWDKLKYLSIAKSLDRIAKEAPAEKKSLCEKISGIFSCFGCTSYCRESDILQFSSRSAYDLEGDFEMYTGD